MGTIYLVQKGFLYNKNFSNAFFILKKDASIDLPIVLSTGYIPFHKGIFDNEETMANQRGFNFNFEMFSLTGNRNDYRVLDYPVKFF